MGKRGAGRSAPPAADIAHDGARICVARIGAAHGLRGEVRLWPFTAEPQAILGYGVLETVDGARRFEIETLRPGKDFLVARFTGIADRDAAEALCNVELYVPRARLPPPPADEFYHADLIGLEARDRAGTLIGTVVGVQNFGAGDLIEIVPAAGGEPLLLPFTAATVPAVEIAAGRIVVDPPPGLFDADEDAEP
jgi:16S rRNA processing protein RimM